MGRKGRKKQQKLPDKVAERTQAPAERTASSNPANTASPPHSSDGPTLLLLGEGIDSLQTRSQKDVHKQHSRPAAKRKFNQKTPDSFQRRRSEHPASKKRYHTQPKDNDNDNDGKVSHFTPQLPPLPSPWLLLPTTIRETLTTRFPTQASFENSCVPLTITRNANITSAINRLKVYLGWSVKEAEPTIQWPEALESDERIVAVSAQGEATAKLASIMDVAKRVVAGGEGEAVSWYSYTGLGSQTVVVEPRTRKDGAGGKENADKTAESLEMPDQAGGEKQQQPEPKIRMVPVLTVWMSKRQIPEFRTPFGEHKFTVTVIGEEK